MFNLKNKENYNFVIEEVEYLCYLLDIEEPQVIVDEKKFETLSPTLNAFIDVGVDPDKQALVRALYIRPFVENEYIAMFCIAHELRHVYQIKNGLFDFDNYKQSHDADIKNYNSQNEEIDANAFANAYLQADFDIRITIEDFKMPAKAIALTIERTEELIQEYFEDFDD